MTQGVIIHHANGGVCVVFGQSSSWLPRELIAFLVTIGTFLRATRF